LSTSIGRPSSRSQFARGDEIAERRERRSDPGADPVDERLAEFLELVDEPR